MQILCFMQLVRYIGFTDDHGLTTRYAIDPPGIPRPRPAAAQPVRLPSTRAGLVLATVMLAIGVAVGAAIGPAPDASFAGGPSAFMKRVPLLIAAIEARNRAAAAANTRCPRARRLSSNRHRHRLRRAKPPPKPLNPRPTEETKEESSSEEAGKSKKRNPPRDHQRLADPARRHDLRSSPVLGDGGPLHRHPADSRRHLPGRLVGDPGDRLRRRGGTRRTPGRRRRAAAAAHDRPAAMSRRRRRRDLRGRNARRS